MAVTLTHQEKSRLLAELALYEKKHGPIAYHAVPALLQSLNIITEGLASTADIRTWVNENVTGIEIKDERFTIDPDALCRRLVLEELKKSGTVLMSNITPLLKDATGYTLAELTGLKPKAWLTTWMDGANCCLSANGLNLEFVNNKNTKPESTSPEPALPPDAVVQMHSLAYMSWWSNTSQSLRRKTDITTMKENDWRDAIARAFARSVLGGDGGLLDASADEVSRLAFRTGFETPDGKPIFCVLLRNPQQGKQPWMLEDFAAAGESDAKGLGQWLSERFFVFERAAEDVSLEKLGEHLDRMDETRSVLTARQPELLLALTEGTPLAEDLPELLKDYREQWAEFRELARSFSWLQADKNCSLPAVRMVLETKSAEQMLVEEAVDRFCALAESTEKMFLRLRKRPDDNAATRTHREQAEKFRQNVTAEGLQALYSLLDGYRALRDLMSRRYLDELEGTDLEPLVLRHFPDLSRFFVTHLVGADEDLRGCLDEIDTIRTLLDNIYQTCFSEPNRTESIAADEIFRICVMDSDRQEILSLPLRAADFPTDELERCIIFGEWEQAEQRIGDAAARAELDISDKEAEAILAGLRTPEEDGDLSFYRVGVRLYRIQGNRNRTAEKFLLAGLRSHTDQCLPRLLDIYRREDAKANFAALCRRFGADRSMSAEDLRYLLEALAAEDAAALQTYLNDHSYLLNIPEYLDTVLRSGRTAMDPEWYRALEQRMEILEAHDALNELEEAVISGEESRISSAITALAEGAGGDYSEDEIAQLQLAQSADYPKGDSNIEKGRRVYLFQKNKFRTAETFFWRSLAEKSERACSLLLTLMAEERRWDECLALRDAYPEQCSSAADAELIMLARVHTDAAGAIDRIRGSLQTCLRLMSETGRPFGAMMRSRVDALRHDTDAAVAGFYDALAQLFAVTEDEVVRAVVLQSFALREFGLAPETLVAHGLTPEDADHFARMFQGNQPGYARSAGGIAARLMNFLKNYRGAAKQFCQFALTHDTADEGTQDLMWQILCSDNDDDGKYALMVQYPALQEKFPEEFRAFLLQHHEYRQFVDRFGDAADFDPLTKIQYALARARISDPWDGILEPGSLTLTGIDPKWIRALLGALAELEGDEAVKLLNAHFDAMLAAYSDEELRTLTSADGVFDEEDILRAQRSAQEKNPALALYYYHTRGVGEMTERMTAWVAERGERMESRTRQQQLTDLRTLRKILSGTDGEALENITLRVIASLAEAENSEFLKDIFQLLRATAFSPDTLHRALELLPMERILLSLDRCRELCTALRDSSKLDRECVAFLHRHFTTKPYNSNSAYRVLLCEVYTDAFRTECFPRELLGEAETVCRTALAEQWLEQAVYCLYHIETLLEREEYAQFTLLLLQKCTGDAIRALVAGIHRETLPSLYGLFRAAMPAPLKQATDFFTYCTTLCRPLADKFPAEIVNIDPDEQEPDIYWSEFLYTLLSQPDNGDLWTRMTDAIPLRDEPRVFSRFLYLSIRYTTNEMLHLRCIDYFEYCGDDAELLAALLAYAGGISSVETMADFRRTLAEKAAADASYFSRWAAKDDLAELVKILCNGGKSHQQEIQHAALRDLSIIVMATGSSETLRILMAHYSQEYLQDNADVGVSVVCRLLLAGRIAEAQVLIAQLDHSVTAIHFRGLITELAALSAEELTAWTGEESNLCLLDMALPDGNRPSIDVIRNQMNRYIAEDRQSVGAQVLYKVLRIFENDYYSYDSLFILCKKNFPQRMQMLHYCLLGLIKNNPRRTQLSYFRRSPASCAEMLARLNGVILATKQDTVVRNFDGYDFTEPAGDYFCKLQGMDEELVSNLNRLQNDTRISFMGRDEKAGRFLADQIVSSITGDWTDYIRSYWNEYMRGPWMDYAVSPTGTVPACGDAFSHIGEQPTGGLLRSLLRLTFELAPVERKGFSAWLFASLSVRYEDFVTKYQTRCEEFERIRTAENEKLFSANFFDYPYEEPSMLTDAADSVDTADTGEDSDERSPDFRWIGSNAIRQVASKEPGSVSFIVTLILDMANDPSAYSTIFSWAMDAFNNGNDQAAFGYFSALEKRKDLILIAPGTDERNALNIRNRKHAKCKALRRLAGTFAEEAETLKEIAKYKPWRCANMVLALVTTRRANEVLRLKRCLSDGNAALCDTILLLINRQVDNQTKFEAVTAAGHDLITEAILCLLAKHGSIPTKRATGFLINDPVIVEKLNERYLEICEIYKDSGRGGGKVFRGNSFAHILLLESVSDRLLNRAAVENQDESFRTVNRLLESVKDPDRRTAEERGQSVPAAGLVQQTAAEQRKDAQPKTLPAFAAALTGQPPVGSSLSDLFRTFTEKQRNALDAEAAYAAAKDLYLLARDTGERETEALICLGIAHYSLHKKDRSAANQGLKELMQYPLQEAAGTEAYESLVQRCPVMLGELLYLGYDNLREMVKDYRTYHNAFIRMRDMLVGSAWELVDQVYLVLGEIAEIFNPAFGIIDTQDIMDKLTVANQRLAGTGARVGGRDIRTQVRRLILDEQNELNRRPKLVATVLNDGPSGYGGMLYGMVENIGHMTATGIEIQARFDNGSISKRYSISRLAPGKSAVFAVSYSAVMGTETLGYELITNYRFKDEHLTAPEVSGMLSLSDAPVPHFATNVYASTAETEFVYDEESGEVRNPNFYGRETEKLEIASLYSHESFAEYENALIRGVKRTGKTSLLNYIAAYAGAHCRDALVIQVDAQHLTSVYELFIGEVLEKIREFYPEFCRNQAWKDLEEKWMVADRRENFNAKDLQYFYHELKKANDDRGLILIIDEIDVVFAKDSRVDTVLFPALRSLMEDRVGKAAVHFVLCGSNQLFRFAESRATLGQLFNLFENTTIQVGCLPKEDMTTMLQDPYTKHYPHVKYTQAALDLIWDYTGGLVWYTKLLGTEIMKFIKSARRSIVYPWDVHYCVKAILKGRNFTHLEKDTTREERLVLYTLHSLAGGPTEYVSYDQLREKIGDELQPDQLNDVLNLLVTMQLIERRDAFQNQYRYAISLFWYYFRSQHPCQNQKEEDPREFRDSVEMMTHRDPGKMVSEGSAQQ